MDRDRNTYQSRGLQDNHLSTSKDAIVEQSKGMCKAPILGIEVTLSKAFFMFNSLDYFLQK